jgi:hypothetical protein
MRLEFKLQCHQKKEKGKKDFKWAGGMDSLVAECFPCMHIPAPQKKPPKNKLGIDCQKINNIVIVLSLWNTSVITKIHI